MDQQVTQKQQAVEVLRGAQSVVVTTSQNPNLDQVAGVIALTQILKSTGKKATAIVNAGGKAGFLKPGEVVSQTLDSVRDFIIQLNVSKTMADKFKYNIEDNTLKIMVTPANGFFTGADVTTAQGEFNVDTVVMLGVERFNDLSQVVKGHDDLLKKATLVNLVCGNAQSDVKGIVWQDEQASSVSEMLISTSEALGAQLDKSIATALLAGISSATKHFMNEKTTPKVMTMAAQLMAAGADQQTIVKELHNSNQNQNKPQAEKPAEVPKPAKTEVSKPAETPKSRENSKPEPAPAENQDSKKSQAKTNNLEPTNTPAESEPNKPSQPSPVASEPVAPAPVVKDSVPFMPPAPIVPPVAPNSNETNQADQEPKTETPAAPVADPVVAEDPSVIPAVPADLFKQIQEHKQDEQDKPDIDVTPAL